LKLVFSIVENHLVDTLGERCLRLLHILADLIKLESEQRLGDECQLLFLVNLFKDGPEVEVVGGVLHLALVRWAYIRAKTVDIVNEAVRTHVR